jgi:2-polyprenyl-3-methyl-5-hydroxy-6-metoxy-1,4-benzoquinol methylase
MDYETDIVEQAQQRYPNLRLVAGNIETFETDEEFDVVILGDLIEHLSNAGLALDRVARLLAPDGQVLISTPNAFGLPNYLRFLAGRFVEGEDHVHCFTKYTLSNLLRRHRFTVQEVLTCYQSPKSREQGFKLRVFSRLFRAFPELGGTLLIVAAPASSRTASS